MKKENKIVTIDIGGNKFELCWNQRAKFRVDKEAPNYANSGPLAQLALLFWAMHNVKNSRWTVEDYADIIDDRETQEMVQEALDKAQDLANPKQKKSLENGPSTESDSD